MLAYGGDGGDGEFVVILFGVIEMEAVGIGLGSLCGRIGTCQGI